MKTNNPFGALGQLPNNFGSSMALIANGIGMMGGAPSNTGLINAGRAMDRDAQERARQQRFAQLMRDPDVAGSLPKNIQAILPFMAPQAAGDIIAQYQARTARDARDAAAAAENRRRYEQDYNLQREKFELQKQKFNKPRADEYETRAAAAQRFGLTPGTQQFQDYVLDRKGVVDGRKETTEQREITKKRIGIASENLKTVPSIVQGQRVIAQLENIAKESGLESAIGPIQGSENVQNFADTLLFSRTLGLSNPSTNAAIRRLQSQLEILGGESQRGLGAQSEADAKRIRGAIAGLTSSRDSDEFKQNLNIIRQFIERGLGRAQEAARQYPKLGEMYPGLSVQQAPQPNKRGRYNPNTGEIEGLKTND